MSNIKQLIKNSKQELERIVRSVQNNFKEERITVHNKVEKLENELNKPKVSHENVTRRPSESHSSLSSPNIEGLQTDDHDPNKVHLWIIGSSIIKDLKANLIYRQKNVKLTTLRDKTIYGARQLLKDKKIMADNILFHIGSNDLEGKTAEDVMEDARLLFNETKELFPACSIASEILPRFYRDRRDSLYFEQKHEKYNKFLSELCSEENIHLVQ